MQRLKDLREDMDMTQIAVSERIGCNQTTYSRYETGGINLPVDILIKLADLYDVSTDYILGRTDEKRLNRKTKKRIS